MLISPAVDPPDRLYIDIITCKSPPCPQILPCPALEAIVLFYRERQLEYPGRCLGRWVVSAVGITGPPLGLARHACPVPPRTAWRWIWYGMVRCGAVWCVGVCVCRLTLREPWCGGECNRDGI